MKSLYAMYLEEREGFNVVESEKGFATYKFFGTECYIRDVFVKPEHRKENIASNFADEIAVIAKRNGCDTLIGTVSPAANGSTASIQVLLSYGFKVRESRIDQIIFFKEIA